MRSVSKGANTRDELVNTAKEYVLANGAADLTLRELGELVGLHFTALYRHFRNKDELLAAVFLQLASDMLVKNAAIKDPKKRLLTLGLGIREVQRKYPELVTALANSEGGTDTGTFVQTVILESLREMNVPKERLAVCYQALESYVNGASYFDFSGAPSHLETRQARHGKVGDPALASAARSAKATEALNEKAYRWGLESLLEAATAK